MGKKGSWFSAIRRVFFTPHSSSKDKRIGGPERTISQEKKKGRRRLLKRGEFKSFIFREPSSIEKILGEIDEQRQLVPLYSEQKIVSERPTSPRSTPPRTTPFRDVSPKHSPPREVSPRVASPKPDPPIVSSQQAASSHVALPKPASPKAASPRVASSKVNQNRKETSNVYRAEPTFQVLQRSAIRIQSIFRGYMARRNFRSLRGLLRLQGFIKGDNVKKQTINAMKQMHLFVRIQNQIRLRRIEMSENQAAQWQTSKNYKKDGESTLSKWSLPSEAGNNENWDGSRLTKDEVDERRQKKLEATMKRERAMAYAYSHKLWKANPKYKMNIQPNGFPLWWKWLEHALPSVNHSVSQSAVKKSHQSPARAISECTPSPLLRNYTEYGEHFEADTPTSTKSSVPARPKPFHTPGRTPPSSSRRKKYAHSGASFAGSPYKFPSKDDDSLTSFPPYSVPNYMSPTISAKAKAKASPREGSIGTPSSHSARRLSYPLTSNVGSFKWNRGSSKGGASSLKDFSGSADRLSVDSAVSMPASVGRKPFNRFV